MIDLVVEDGTMPAGANTYVDLGRYRAYIAQRHPEYDPDAADDTKESASLVRAFDTLNSYAWDGYTTLPGRSVAWPRKEVTYADGTPVPSDVVPVQVAHAQCELAWNIQSGADPLAPVNKDRGAVLSEKADVIAVTYADPETSTYSGATGYPAVDGLLRQFLSGGSGRFSVVELGRG